MFLVIIVMVFFPAVDITFIEINVPHSEKIGLDEIWDRKLYQIKANLLVWIDGINIFESMKLIY